MLHGNIPATNNIASDLSFHLAYTILCQQVSSLRRLFLMVARVSSCGHTLHTTYIFSCSFHLNINMSHQVTIVSKASNWEPFNKNRHSFNHEKKNHVLKMTTDLQLRSQDTIRRCWVNMYTLPSFVKEEEGTKIGLRYSMQCMLSVVHGKLAGLVQPAAVHCVNC